MNFWESIFTTCELFRTIAPIVGDTFGYVYNTQEDKNMMSYLEKMKNSTP